jgi:coatomer protein complex subunit gamma
MSDFRFNDEVKIIPVPRFDDLRKDLTLQNASIFNEKNVQSEQCIEILINLIYLLNKGEKFSEKEKESIFFSATKLLHNANPILRRIIFLFVKHLNWWQSSFILTGSLITELNGDDDLIKPNCFRLLGQITDASSVNVVERLLKEAINNENHEIASSALCCTLFMSLKGFGIAKSWINEISEKLNSSLSEENLLTFHTLLLLKEIKKNDKLFLIKIFSRIAETSGSRSHRSQFAICQLIRYVTDLLLKSDLEESTKKTFHIFLQMSLYRLEESIKIEAARSIMIIPNISASIRQETIATLCELISSSNKIVRFAALKTLDKHIDGFAQNVAVDIFLELEKIIEDSGTNSSIKSYAFSIFLKISKGLSDYRLEKMFKTFIEQYTKFKEDFKKKLINISKNISRENPTKNKLYYDFFCSVFKLDAGPQTKLEILDALIWFIYNDKDLKLQTIFFLAESLFDCQYDVLKIRIINLLGKECELVNNKSKLVRYIYNQLLLEFPAVRASAISALGEIGFKENNLRDIIISLIENCLNDDDNEVRERAFMISKALKAVKGKKKEDEQLINFVFPQKVKNPSPVEELNIDLIQLVLNSEKENLLKSDDICQELVSILNDTEKISEILIKDKEELKKKEKKEKKRLGLDVSERKKSEDDYATTMFTKIYGPPKVITPYKKLTDQSAEYLTKYRKIVHDKIVVMDFEITNTIEFQIINDVSLDMQMLNYEGFDLDKTEIIPIKSLKTNESGHLYFKLLKNKDSIYSNCSFNCTLKFDLQELDVKGNPHGIPVKETYKLDKPVEVCYADYYIKNSKVNLENFAEFWKQAEKSGYEKAVEKMVLNYNNGKNAGKIFSETIGFEPLNDLEKIDNSAKKFEFAYAYKNYFENLIFIKFTVIFNAQNECFGQIIILSQDASVPEMILSKIYS